MVTLMCIILVHIQSKFDSHWWNPPPAMVWIHIQYIIIDDCVRLRLPRDCWLDL